MSAPHSCPFYNKSTEVVRGEPWRMLFEQISHLVIRDLSNWSNPDNVGSSEVILCKVDLKDGVAENLRQIYRKRKNLSKAFGV